MENFAAIVREIEKMQQDIQQIKKRTSERRMHTEIGINLTPEERAHVEKELPEKPIEQKAFDLACFERDQYKTILHRILAACDMGMQDLPFLINRIRMIAKNALEE